MPKLTSVADATPIRIVIVTLDSHLASAATRARSALRRDMPGLELAVHAADEWGDDATALAQCRSDIAKGDIIVTTMMFLDDHIRAIIADLAARRDLCDAMFCGMSADEVMRLTRLGAFSMNEKSRGLVGLLKRLRGKSAGSKASGATQMKMLKRLPQVLRFIPGKAQDLRTYFLGLQYWLAGTDDNIEQLVRMLIDKYASGPRAVFRGRTPAAQPKSYPDVGLYHPRAKSRIVEKLDQLPKGGEVGTVGVLVMRSYVLAGNTGHYDGAIAALEAKGLRVIPAFASGLDARPAIEEFFFEDGVPIVDTVVSLTGFSLVGGPAFNDAKAAESILAALDVPYVAAHPVEFQTLEQWQQNECGLTPVEATMMVAIPELDGAILPMTFGGRFSSADGVRSRDMAVHPERAAMLAARVAKLITLRKTKRAERKLAIVLFNFPPNGGSTGTAAYLSVYESLHHVLVSLKAEGYDVDVPDNVDALRTAIIEGNASRYGTDANVVTRIPADTHVRRERWLAEIEKQWGPAPGRHQTDGSSLFVYGATFGNIFVGVQPAFGYEGDPMRLLFERGFAPTHAFSAFYRWIGEDFGANAVLHFGTHGALEFMPGKQAGLSGDCWPDRLIGDLPNIYLYASNNPSEGTLAKRRTGATLVSYLTPAVSQAGLYRGLVDLKTSLDRWRLLAPDADNEQRSSLAELIQAQATQIDLCGNEPSWDGTSAARIDALHAQILELEYTLIPNGLHVIGRPMDTTSRADILDAAGITETAQREALDAVLSTDHETPNLIHALDGGYVRPAPGGDLIRNTDVLPTGRNLHGFDPFRIPSAFAIKDGARQAERLLERHTSEGLSLPETVAIVLWGTDNLKTEGGPIAQALWLLGAEPRQDGYGRLCGAQLVPLEQLGRPRIDVVVTLSGIFRDLLPLQTKLLAEAALLAARADEDVDMNYVRRHALDYQQENGGSLEQAALRVFSNAEGTYGANVNHLVDHGGWNDEDELAEAYLRRKSFAYGADGKNSIERGVLSHALKTVEATYQNLDSIELGVTSVDHYFDTLGGITRVIKKMRGERAPVYIGDQTHGNGIVRTLAEQVSLETRTRALNPKWYEALLSHGYEGVRQIEAHVTNTLGWSATTGQVAPWVYQHLTETYMLDPAMRERLASLNPKASAKVANRLIEAHERNYWSPNQETLDVLRRASEDLEDRLEGIGAGMAA